MKIVIRSIPHSEQRYETCGDYWTESDGTVQFRVDQMGDERYEFLVAVHELIERFLCKHEGIKESDIDAFDIEYEKRRPEGNNDEPGDDKDAPYRKQHLFATGVEKLLAAELGVDWNEYDRAVVGNVND